MSEIEAYEKVAEEVDSGKVKAGLWAKSFAESNGDENRTRALYMKLRVAEILSEYELAAQEVVAREKADKLLVETKKLEVLEQNLKSVDDCVRALQASGYAVENFSSGRPGFDRSMNNDRWKIIVNKNGDYYPAIGFDDLKGRTIELLMPAGSSAGRSTDKSTKDAPDSESDAGKVMMFFGGFYFSVGALITLVTYSAASPGKIYVLAWGAMLFGVIQFIRGLIKANSS